MNDLFRTVNPQPTSEQLVNKYQIFGFTRNPFPSEASVIIGGSDDRNNGTIYEPEIRTAESLKFEKLLIPSPSNIDTKSVVFLMDNATRQGRGIGKTAFLNYHKKRINYDLGASLSKGTQVLFAVYVNPDLKTRSFWGISKLIIDALIQQNIISLAMCRLRVIQGNILPEHIADVTLDNIQDTIGNDNWLKGKGLDAYSINQKIRVFLTKNGLSSDLADKLARFGANDELYTYFFSVQKDNFWRENANNILFNSFVKLFQLAGFTKGIILFDELEKIVRPQSANERRMFCEGLRYYFADGMNVQNVSSKFFETILTIHPYLQEILGGYWQSTGLERFYPLSGEIASEYTLFFESFKDIHLIIKLCAVYMRASLPDDTQNKADIDVIKPFTQDALEKAIERSSGVPGKFLAFLRYAFEKASDKELLTITGEDIENWHIEFSYRKDEEKTDDSYEELNMPQVKLKD